MVGAGTIGKQIAGLCAAKVRCQETCVALAWVINAPSRNVVLLCVPVAKQALIASMMLVLLVVACARASGGLPHVESNHPTGQPTRPPHCSTRHAADISIPGIP